jgi:ubiquinone/menaquinone biosynthesis C-methylase UbiE
MTPDTAAAAWDRHAAAYQEAALLPTTTATYGPDIPTESELRLLGDLRGKRVLDLGCGGAQASVSFAKAGATAIGVDFSSEQLARGRRLCDAEEVKVELRQGDLADLAFLRADTIDLVFSANAFNYVEDLNRVLRQVHRVLKVGAPLVFSLPHPAYAVLDGDAGPLELRRSYYDRTPVTRTVGGVGLVEYPHTFSDLYMSLARASYRMDQVLEPAPASTGPRSSAYRAAMAMIPATLIIRARKEGN